MKSKPIKKEGKKPQMFICGENEVVVNKAWFMGLLEARESYKKSQGVNKEAMLAHLLGYIESAEFILETDFKQSHK